MHEPLTFEQLSWAAFLARVFGETGPSAYMTIFSDKQFREDLVFHPERVSHEDIQDKLIGGFLNKWRSRFPNDKESGTAILSTIGRLSPSLQVLNKYDIERVNFDDEITVGNLKGTIFQCITYVFEAIRDCYGFRTTAGAKILGILNPNLFVMWDDEIAYKYGLEFVRDNRGHIYSGEGYATFLRKMQEIARVFVSDFQSQFSMEDAAMFLSKRLRITPAVPLAKFIDEYNWITITNNIEVPPKWHPCNDKKISVKMSDRSANN